MKIRLLFTCLMTVFLFSCQNGKIKLNNLRTELSADPVGIDCTQPRFSWEILGAQRGIEQVSYHLLVASSLEKLHSGEGDLWDSGEVESNVSAQIPYDGKPLESRMQCYWKVKINTNKGNSGWSRPAQWSMGLLQDSDWQAKWTGLDQSFEWDAPKAPNTRLSARYFRKEFETEQSVKRAMIYISGLGLYKLYLNGAQVGDQELAPTPTDYTKSVKYNTFDVTPDIRQGNNAIGVTLGNGRFFSMRINDDLHHGLPNNKHFGFPKMLVQLEIEYKDGSKQVIISDNTWKVTADGPIRANNEFDGEEYDATKEMPDWNKTGFDDSQWLMAELTDAPGGRVEAQLNKNIKVMDLVKPIHIDALTSDVYIMDMGQNMVGWLRMKVKGAKGDTVKLRFAETLNPDGSLYMANLRGALVTDQYILKGSDEEVWNPVFTYHGFRYVEITGYPGTPTIDNFEGQVLYDEMETTGSFVTSDSTINQIYKNAYWGIKGNYRGMPTDCPQRDERMGWLGDRAAGSLGESFIFNNDLLYAKWLDDIQDAQRENGEIPGVAPNYWDIYNDDMTWPAAYVIITDMLYNQFSDVRPMMKHYDSIKKWLAYMKDKYMVDYIMDRDTYGDWCLPPESPEIIQSQDPTRRTEGALLGTAYYYHMTCLMKRFAGILGKTEDITYYDDLSQNIKNAYNGRFFNQETQQYSNNTVTANLISLSYGLVPQESETGVFKNIIAKTHDDFNNHVSTGLIGVQWLMRGLSNYGRPDLAFTIATNRDYPSWGYMVENGATTIWELWNGNTAAPDMNSGNHVMLLGDLITWYYEYLAGIQNDPSSTGFKKIRMHPYPVNGLDHVSASYHSVHGLIKSEWQKKDGIFKWNITIPGNTTAIVYVPATSKEKIIESGKKVSESEGVKLIEATKSYVVYEIGSGHYNFTSNIQP